MTTFEFFQIFIDIVFLFLILLLVAGRAWKKGAAGTRENEQESYREMISTLSVLIKEMKETSADLQERIGEKQVEVARTLAAIEDRMERLKNAVPSESVQAKPVRKGPEPARKVVREAPSAARAETGAREEQMTEEERKRAEEEKERKEKYRQVMDLAVAVR